MPNSDSSLTPMQERCLVLVAQNRTSKEIAIELGLSHSTVDQYINRAMLTLGTPNRREAARLYAQILSDTQLKKFELKSLGLVEPPISNDAEAAQPMIDTADPRAGPTINRKLGWMIERFGGAPHDLNRLEILRAILWTALVATGVLACIITIGAWLNYQAP